MTVEGYARNWIDRVGCRLALHIQDGDGPFVVLQHGLCGDAQQPADVFPSDVRARHVVLECRGHGQSSPGALDGLSIATFADDLSAATQGLGENRLIVGGISMGAAIALRLAVTRPDMVSGLILVRPAWLFANAPDNMQPNLEVGERLAQPESPKEADAFRASKTGGKLEAKAPDNLNSLLGFFERSPRNITSALLKRISQDGPGVSQARAEGLNIKTLVIGNGDDLIHPLSHARRLAEVIPSARHAEIPSKSRDKAGHFTALRAKLADFIRELIDA